MQIFSKFVKRLGLATGAVVACLAVASQAQSPDRNWEGPYAGVHLGWIYSDFTNSVPAFPGPTGDAGSAIGGIQLGYNWVNGDTLFGAEVDFSAMELKASSLGGRMEENSMGSLRFRVGRIMGETLVYGSIGAAWTHKDSRLTGLGSTSDYEPGLMLGGGYERWLSDGMTGRIEAFYVDVPTSTQVIGGIPVRGGSQNVIIRAGVNLHF